MVDYGSQQLGSWQPSRTFSACLAAKERARTTQRARTIVAMTRITLGLDDDLAARLAARAARAGMTPEELAEGLLAEDLRDADAEVSTSRGGSAAFGFFDTGSSATLRGRDVDSLLAEGLGQ